MGLQPKRFTKIIQRARVFHKLLSTASSIVYWVIRLNVEYFDIVGLHLLISLHTNATTYISFLDTRLVIRINLVGFWSKALIIVSAFTSQLLVKGIILLALS